jgi:outer membrane protein assembly factor BamB
VRNVLDISASETEIFIRANPGPPFHILEAETGFLEASFPDFEGLPILRIEDEVVYRLSSTDKFQAISLQDKVSLWEIRFRNDFAGIRFTDDLIFILVDELEPRQIYAIERATGEILWKSADNIVSDVVISEDTLYALTAKSQLIGIDIHTGEVIGKLDFKPTFLELEREESYNTLDYSLYLAAVDDKVLVYIGSGRQLFAFRFVPD